MKIIVTAYRPNEYLLENFTKLFRKFWGDDELMIDIAKEDEKKSEQIKRILHTIDDDYFILLAEDFYLLEPVNKSLLTKVEKYAIDRGIDRFGLQCVYDGYNDCSRRVDTIESMDIYQLHNDAQYLCSLEASIWKKECLAENLYIKGSDRDIETNTSLEMRYKDLKVLVSEKQIVTYTDALRGGKPRIEIRNGEMFKLGPDGWITTNIFL